MATAWIQRVVIPVVLALGVLSRDFLVDDTDPGITYSPSSQWSQGAQCTECAIHPDKTQTHDGTWHDTTYDPSQDPPRSITFSFTGSAVSVYNILPGLVPTAPTTHVDLTFELDGDFFEPFTYDPSDDSFQYGQRVFQASDLKNTSHTLIIQATTGVLSVVLFDYIRYTVPDLPPAIPSSSTTSSTSTSVVTSHAALTSSSTSSLLSTSSSSSSLSSLSPPSSSSSVPQSTSPVAFSTPSSLLPSTTSLSDATRSQPSAQPAEHPRSSDGSSMQSSNGVPSAPASPQPQNASTNRTVPIGAVIGGAAGGGVFLLALAAGLVYMLCKRRMRRISMADEYDVAGDDKPLGDEGRDPRSAAHWSSLNSRTESASRLLPASSSIIVIGESYTDRSIYSRSSAQSASAAAPVTAAESHSSCRPASFVQEDMDEKQTPFGAAENSVLSRLTMRAMSSTRTRRTSEPPSPDAGVLERLAALQEEMEEIRARQVQAEVVAALTGEAPPSYHEA